MTAKRVKHFGQYGAAELIDLIWLYCLVPITRNGLNGPAPPAEAE
jgi:hypothetical protein